MFTDTAGVGASSGPTEAPIPSSNSQKSSKIELNCSLNGLQTDEQRKVLDTVAQVRKCGLESVLSLPQLVVCGDQSAGKSSVLEALTEIPFPRADNLCTRFATEIILRRANSESLTIKVIPDQKRPSAEKGKLEAFQETISDFRELPRVMDKAMREMGLTPESEDQTQRAAFARDVLSIEIEGPERPQLTLVDIPGLIQTESKGITKQDIDMVMEITEEYIKKERTICLAVIPATSDYSTQKILTKVRDVDPQGERTLGIITKPDRLPQGSGSERAFIDLAKNEDIFLTLGWHVIKNRAYEEREDTFTERNISEDRYFRTSNFKELPRECLGIEQLRERLSALLFDHVRKELPKLRADLEEALMSTKDQLAGMGVSRSSPGECRRFLSEHSMQILEISTAAVEGHYERPFFNSNLDAGASATLSKQINVPLRRLRAIVQKMNGDFNEKMRLEGHKYALRLQEDDDSESGTSQGDDLPEFGDGSATLERPEAIAWAQRALESARGKELTGNFNPLLIGELFWDLSAKWEQFAKFHIDRVYNACHQFLEHVFLVKSPKDMKPRIWEFFVNDALKGRLEYANQELQRLLEDNKCYPINYNHDYTDTIRNRRQNRLRSSVMETIRSAASAVKEETPNCPVNAVAEKAAAAFVDRVNEDMEEFSCEEALDCVLAIYKVSVITFVANVTTQVIERHIVRGLERIFSPVLINQMSDSEVQSIASEPESLKRQRDFLKDRLQRLEQGRDIFRSIIGSVSLDTSE